MVTITRTTGRRAVLLLAALTALLTGAPAPAHARTTYDGAAAARWALSHAQDTQPDIAGCTWFASQALWAGGMPKDRYWNDTTISNLIFHGVAGSRTATLASDLYKYLAFNTGTQVTPLAGPHAQSDRFGTNAVPEARLGDLIAYDWDGDDIVDHMTVVTHISKNDYPDVSEWGTAPDRKSDYVYRGWTWSENQKSWLRTRYPHVIATLLTIAP